MKYQDGPKPAKWDAQFQAYDIEGKAVLEALKKLMAFTILKENGPETEYSRKLAQYNPNLKARFSPRQDPKEVKQPGVMTVKFQMGNMIFSQEFVVCNDLVRPMIIGRDFTVNNFIGIAWTRQETKKITQDDKLVIEIEEPMR